MVCGKGSEGSQLVNIDEGDPARHERVVDLIKGVAEIVCSDLNAATFNSPTMKATANSTVCENLLDSWNFLGMDE